MLKQIRIKTRAIGQGLPVFIIAEAGVNHNGNIRLAKKLIDAAKKAGADAVKFQTYQTEELVTLTAPKADYQKKKVPGVSQFDMLKRYELSEKNFRELKLYCETKNILFLSSPFDLSSAKLLKRMNVAAFKLGSGELTNAPLIKEIATYQMPLILSTGMSTLPEIKNAIQWFKQAGGKKLVLLHCTSNYPAAYGNVNLKALATMQKAFPFPIGYSDHTLGIEVAIAAVALGACLIEKHLTLDKKMAGPDHAASLNPSEFTNMVNSIRHVEMAQGTTVKKPVATEFEVLRMARKSVVAAVDILPLERIKREMLTVKRPGTGIAPVDLNKMLNRTAKVMIKKDQLLSWTQVK